MSWLTPNSPQIGLFLQMDGTAAPATTYEKAIELIVAAEELGLNSARVTQHHFGERNGWLPSPLPFLAVVGQRTKNIRLGTVVITIPLETPLRLAEDIAVTDLISQGRLEIGFGSGLGADIFATFGLDYEKRREITRAGLAIILKALRNESVDDAGTRLQPFSPGLSERLWLAVMSESGAINAAENGLGLLLGRVEHGGWSPVENQKRTTQLYRQNLKTGEARIAAGRTIYPAKDRKTAERELSEALEPIVAAYIRSGLIPSGTSFEDILGRLHIIYGHPQEIIQTLAKEKEAIGWTELLVQVDPGNMPQAKALRALEIIAQEIAPNLTPQSISL